MNLRTAAVIAMTATIRTRFESMPNRLAIPPHTPPRRQSSALRRSGFWGRPGTLFGADCSLARFLDEDVTFMIFQV
jgi:hypothetical protein